MQKIVQKENPNVYKIIWEKMKTFINSPQNNRNKNPKNEKSNCIRNKETLRRCPIVIADINCFTGRFSIEKRNNFRIIETVQYHNSLFKRPIRPTLCIYCSKSNILGLKTPWRHVNSKNSLYTHVLLLRLIEQLS